MSAQANMSTNDTQKRLSELVMNILWPKVKNQSYITVASFLAEAEAFECFENAGVAFVRSVEGSGIDAALVCSHELSSLPMPDPRASTFDKWKWWRDQTGAIFLTIDIKYGELLPSPQSARAYVFSNPPSTKPTPAQEACEVIVLISEGDRNHAAIMPREVWDAAREIGYGIEPLIARTATWCYPFMVDRQDLLEATRRLAKTVISKKAYINPTTGVALDTWFPKGDTAPELTVSDKLDNDFKQSFNVITRQWKQLEEVGCTIRLNPVNPLLFDFLIQLPGSSKWLRIEHKAMTGWNFATDDRSPWHPGRVWHMVIIAQKSTDEIVCIPRHIVGATWFKTATPLDYNTRKQHTFRGVDAIRSLIEHMRQHTDAAVTAAVNALSYQPSANTDDVSILVSSSASQRVPSIPKNPTGGLPSRKEHDVSLPWLTQHINVLCMMYRSMILYPLDGGHAVADHVLARYTWTDDDIASFENTGLLPKPIYHREMQDKISMPLRFQDFCAPDGQADILSPVWIRQSSVRLPACDQQFVIIGKLIRNPGEEERPIDADSTIASSLLCLPSGLTTIFDHDLREEGKIKAMDQYFRKNVQQKDDIAPIKGWKWHPKTLPAKRLEKGSPFLKPGIDPQRFIVEGRSGELGSLWWNLHRMLHSDGMTNVFGVPGDRENTQFYAPDYQTTIRDMMQKQVDYGLNRKPAEAEKPAEGEPKKPHYGKGHPKPKPPKPEAGPS